MLTTIYARKGGSGATTVTALAALTLARTENVVALDLAGDLAAMFGIPEPCPTMPGSRLAIAALLRGDAANIVELASVPAGRGVQLVGYDGPLDDYGIARAAAFMLADDSRRYVVDAGTIRDDSPEAAFVGCANEAICVTRNCYLGLRHLVGIPYGRKVVLIEEPGRAIGRREVADVIGRNVTAVLPYDTSIARAIDAGLAGARTDTYVRHMEAALTVRIA